MFCSECGAKNKSTDAFCCECGHKLEVEEKPKAKSTSVKAKKEPEKDPVTEPVKVTKKMSKGKKALLIIILVVAAVLFAGYKYGQSITSPKHIAKEYIDAIDDCDTDKLYSYLDLDGDTTFISKDVYKEIAEEKYGDIDIDNYKIEDVDIDGLTATVDFTYVSKGSKSKSYGTVNLTKQKGKKWLIFDNWKISDTNVDDLIVKDYTIKVLKGSKVTFGGIELTEKYLNEKKSTKALDTYVLPQVFSYETDIVITLPNGLELEDEVTPNSYYDDSYTMTFDEDSLTSEMKDELVSKSKDALTKIYENVIAGKTFDQVKGDYEHEGLDLSDLKDSYNDLLDEYTDRTYALTKINFKSVSLYDVDLNDDGYLAVEVYTRYDYTYRYTYSDGTTYDGDSYSYDYKILYFAYADGDYYLVDFND